MSDGTLRVLCEVVTIAFTAEILYRGLRWLFRRY